MDKFTEEELKAMLKELSESEALQEIRDIAMCYCPAPMGEEPDIEEPDIKLEFMDEISSFYPHLINEVVESIKDLGYDAKVEFVGDDSIDIFSISSDKMHIKFYFKDKGQEQYHIVECDDPNNYQIVLNYLSRKAQWDSSHDEPSPSGHKDPIPLNEEEASVIREMTGLTVEG